MTHRRPTLIPLMRPVNAWLVASMITFAGIAFSGAGFNDVGFNRTASADDGNGQGAWKRHTIDDQARGADGVRLADFNGDGLADVVTGWEESGLVRLYLNPGPDRSKEPWPSVTVGKAKSPEDAVPFDVDGDGHLDVVSCHEGKQRQILVHWNPADRTGDNDTLLDASKWTTDSFEKLDGVMWMFAVPLTTADSSRTLVVGAKGSKASITLLRAPKTNPRELGTWTVARLRDAGWIMSLRSIDMDGDGDHDLVFTDRKGRARGAAWLEQPGDPMQAWPEHPIAGQQHEAMFLTATADRCMIATRNNETLDCVRSGSTWQTRKLPNPDGASFGKAIESLPDGRIILTCNTAAGPNPDRPGIWIGDDSGNWNAVDPTTGVKFDRMELIDLDGDGDLDVMTCEERKNLGVIWYENPGR